MDRDEAIAEAQRRNVEEFRRTGELRSVWAEFEARPGEWAVGMYEHARRPLWRRVARGVAEIALEPSPTQGGILPEPPARAWRRRR